MLVDFLENPQTKVVNIFFEKDQKINKKYIGNSSSYLQIRKKMKILHKNIIFSFNKFEQIKKFYREFKFSSAQKSSIYCLYNSNNSQKINKVLILIFLISRKKKCTIFFHGNYQNSFKPDFLYKIKFKSKLNALIYFFYQFFKNCYLILKSKMILIKVL
mgnify:CR=1 FL=1|tara:strand:- start:1423 stop:1899 length:477 start_codon:yes stop_codon:yes gene_type:complete